MIKIIVFSLTLWLALPTWGYSQDEPAAYAVDEEYTLWNLAIGDTARVHADKAYIRHYPSLDGQIIDSITVGTVLIITSPAYNSTKVRGFSAPWYEVSYQQNNQTKKGFIWIGLLALGQKQDAAGNLYLYGFEKFHPFTENESDQYSCTIKRMDARTGSVTAYAFKLDDLGQTYTECKLLPAMGLEGLQQIFRVAYMGEACGIPSDYVYAGWNGEQFISMPARYTVSDAGVFYYEEKLLFPTEHQKEKNMIYKYIEEGEVIGENAEELEYKITKREEKYRWDGKQFSRVQENK